MTTAFDERILQAATEGAFTPVTEARYQRSYECRHDKLHGQKRCLGCGRTRNEVALDGER